MQIAAQAICCVFSALAGSNASGAVAAGAAPLLAQMVRQAFGDNDAMRILLHTLASGLIARTQGGSVAGAVAGGFTAASLGTNDAFSRLFFGKEAALLTADEKQLIANIVTLAGAGVGGAVGGGTGAGSGGSAARTEVENNALSVPQIESFAEKAKGCEASGDCGQNVKEMEDLSLNQQKEMIAVCASNASAYKEKYGDIPANGMLVRQALDGLFDADVPSQMKNDISSFWAQQMEAEGVVSSTEFASQLQSRYGIDSQQAGILAGAVLGAVTGGMGKGGKPEAGTAGKNIVVVDSGKIGAWNKAMNNPEPNTVYNVDGNKTYQTDELTRTTNASASLSLSKNDRNGYQQCKAGKCGNPGDEGGHLIASIFNGPGEKLNLVPMDGNLNKGAWKQMKNTWANALKDGGKVAVNIQPIYSGNNTRPDRVIVKYSIDGGGPVNIDFKNSLGGK